MQSSLRPSHLKEFLSHLNKYGFLERSAESASARSFGLPFADLCQNLAAEFLRSLDVDVRSDLISRRYAQSLGDGFLHEPHIPEAIDRLAAYRPLNSSSNKETVPTLSVVHALCNYEFDPLSRDWHSLSSSSSSLSLLFERPVCRHLSVVRFFPPPKAPPTLGFQLRQRRRFFRHWAELPRHFRTFDDELFYAPDVEGGDRQVKEDDGEECRMDELDEKLIAPLRDERGYLIERVRNLPLASLSSSSSSSSFISDLGALPDADLRLVEVRMDLHRTALAYLVDAFRIWKTYGNFSLHYRLAPRKVVVVLRQSDAADVKVGAVAKYIREYLEFKKMTCKVEVIKDKESVDDERVVEECASEFTQGDSIVLSKGDSVSGRVKPKNSGRKINPDPAMDFLVNRDLHDFMDENGMGVPFFISIDKTMMEHGVLKVYERETRLAEYLHLNMLLPKLVDYLNGYPYDQ